MILIEKSCLPKAQRTLDRIHIGLELEGDLATSGVDGPTRFPQPFVNGACPVGNLVDPGLVTGSRGVERQDDGVGCVEVASGP